MERIQVLIVEDELIIAEDMKEMLRELHYDVIGIATDYEEAGKILGTRVPDIALLDIHLRGNQDGIALALSIRDKFDIPVVFVSSYSDRNTVERAKHVRPEGYIVKPFTREDLFTSIEIALFNHANNRSNRSESAQKDEETVVLKDHIFIRKDYMLIKIRFEELMWIRSELNYLELHCQENKYLIRSTLKEFVDKLPSDCFLQVHKSYCVNTRHITAIDHSHLWLNRKSIPIGRSFLEAVRKALNVEL